MNHARIHEHFSFSTSRVVLTFNASERWCTPSSPIMFSLKSSILRVVLTFNASERWCTPSSPILLPHKLIPGTIGTRRSQLCGSYNRAFPKEASHFRDGGADFPKDLTLRFYVLHTPPAAFSHFSIHLSLTIERIDHLSLIIQLVSVTNPYLTAINDCILPLIRTGRFVPRHILTRK